jgi:hypothetical protein
MDEKDEIARLMAQGDQAKAGTEEFAGVIGAFYGTLTGSGMFPEHALQVTLHWMSIMGEAPEAEGDDE